MASEDGAASAMHRRCGSKWSPILSMPTPPMHRRRCRCNAGASAMYRRCIGDAAQAFDPIYSDP
eukprot:1304901-Pyramimonas_sp.AAC.1